jgi:hypothetical protein
MSGSIHSVNNRDFYINLKARAAATEAAGAPSQFLECALLLYR